MSSLAEKAWQNMGLGSSMFLAVLVFVAHFHFCYAVKAPYYSFVQESTSAPQVSFYDYIIIGGGTAGCPLAATLSASANILVLERGGSPYANPGKSDKENFFPNLLDHSPGSYSQTFISEDGVYNSRARVLGGGSVINAGFYSHAEADFLKQAGLNEALVNHSYQWVEKKVAFKPPLLQWQSALRNGLLEAGVLPNNGFTYDHVFGTKVGGTIFDTDGHRHTAADLLEYANPLNIKVYLYATVQKIIFSTKVFSRPRADGVIFEDAMAVRHSAFLTRDSKSEVILAAGALGSPQTLMLSGVGPAHQLEALGIKVVMDQPMVGQGMVDNPLNVLFIPSPLPVELSLVSIVGITRFDSYIEACSGVSFAPTWTQRVAKELASILNQTEESSMSIFQEAIANSRSFLNTRIKGGIVFEKVKNPMSRGHLELRSTNPHDNPKVTFNYFQAPEDLRKCVQAMKTVINAINSEAFSNFRYKILSTEALLNLIVRLPLNLRPKHLTSAFSLEQFCIDTVMTIWHYHGGCLVGSVVDKDYKVHGVDALRIIDGSTFTRSPGTNPQATVMMLGRYMGLRILEERHFLKK
ncbi:PREDICTED: protein HOTHEAD [Theobroma cacao]|uniref:Protein HOTHEAD n=1 Tax=Theobroma cacao TaxID=3641 RepID=A0AB32W335_THECC|nr:PREDICTED: protein HOTHEAD [Theobroma cacao]